MAPAEHDCLDGLLTMTVILVELKARSERLWATCQGAEGSSWHDWGMGLDSHCLDLQTMLILDHTFIFLY